LKQNYVKNVYTEDEILSGSSVDEYLNMIHRGFDIKQNGQLVVLYKPGYMEYKATGTTHGSPYSYDTHVPLLFYGWGIKKGKCYDKKVITQIAPTLAQKLKITMPNATNSEVLEEIFRD
jgi:predicted AlkP superfamily pyrophosphatase or phosphodiesterase